jgi:NTE family protein
MKTTNKKSTTPRIGLALGSGGSRGLAHIGVIKILEQHGIKIDLIAGTSIGAMIGGFYAAGIDTPALEKIVQETNWRMVFSLVDPHLKQGLIGGEKVKRFIEKQIDKKIIEDCLIPFAAVATDIKTGEITHINSGSLSQAIRASISIPLVFKPLKIDNRMLADGGLSAPVPVETARQMGADIVIAVNLDKHAFDDTWKPKMLGIAQNSLDILRHHLALENSKSADIIINIDSGKNYWYQFANGQEKITTGENAALEILPKLKELIKNYGKK